MYLKDKIDIVLSKDCFLEVDSLNNLRLKNNDGTRLLPKEKIGSFILENDIPLSKKVFKVLQKNGINLVYIDGRGKYLGALVYQPSKNVHLRVAQFEKHINSKKSLFIAKKIIQAKIRNSFEFLGLENNEFQCYIEKISHVSDSQELLGIEGSSAKKYYNLFGLKNKNKNYVWNGRNKRPPKDEINALLSLGYTVLLYDIVNIINLCGLDPYIGFLHKDYYGRPSLACDILELFRADLVDRFVLNKINCKEFSPDDFEHVNIGEQKVGVYLNKQGKSKFFPKWSYWYKEKEKRWEKYNIICNRKRVVEKEVRHLIHYLTGDSDDYNP